MQGISVIQTCRVFASAVIVYHTGSVNHLILAVSIDIADSQAMCSLMLVCYIFVVIRKAVESPPLHKFSVSVVPGLEDCLGVITPANQYAGTLAVEVTGPPKITVDAVSSHIAELIRSSALNEICACQFLACLSVDDRQEFGSFENHSIVAVRLVQNAVVGASVSVGVSDYCAVTEFGTLGGLHRELCLAVPVEVIETHLCIVCSLTDVQSQIHTPHKGPVHFICVDQIAFIADSTSGVVISAGFHLYNEFVLSVAVKVTHRNVVRGIVALGKSFYRMNRNIEIWFGCQLSSKNIGCAVFSVSSLFAANLDAVLVHCRCVNIRIDEEGRFAEGFGVEFFRVAINIESHVQRITFQIPPAEGNFATSVMNGNKTATQMFFLDTCRVARPFCFIAAAKHGRKHKKQ